jgi:hypothetical protein
MGGGTSPKRIVALYRIAAELNGLTGSNVDGRS